MAGGRFNLENNMTVKVAYVLGAWIATAAAAHSQYVTGVGLWLLLANATIVSLMLLQ